MKTDLAALRLCAGLSGTQGMRFTREEFKANLEPVKVVGAEGCLQNAPNLIVVANRFELDVYKRQVLYRA